MNEKRPDLDARESVARRIATAAGLDPDKLIDMPDGPQGFQQPVWVFIMQRMREEPKKFESTWWDTRIAPLKEEFMITLTRKMAEYHARKKGADDA